MISFLTPLNNWKKKNKQCKIDSEQVKLRLSESQRALSFAVQEGRYSAKRVDIKEEQKRNSVQLLSKVEQENANIKW